MTEAIFIPRGAGRYFATGVARGPWDEHAQHGGAPASLLAHAFEALPAVEGLEIARITYELIRPVPLGDLIVRAEVVRAGRRVQLMEASIITPDEVEVVRARALSVQRARDVTGEMLASDAVPPAPRRRPRQ